MDSSVCKNCGATIQENFCAQCGQKKEVVDITMQGIYRQIYFYLTGFQRGFPYTLKELVKHPGAMQKSYLEGKRISHQKPFSMFFKCVLLSGIGYYLVNIGYSSMYDFGEAINENFFRSFFVMLQAILLPVHTLVTWLSFSNERYSYAETLVMMLYNLAVVLLFLVPIVSITLIFPSFDNRFLQIVFLLIYNSATNIHFYEGHRAVIILKTLLAVGVSFLLSQFCSDLILGFLK